MNREMAIELLKSAASDLETIEAIMHNENLTHISAFHAQQCVEKSLKAVLELYKRDIPKTHSVLKLSKLSEGYLDIDNKETADELDKLYIDARYPGDFGLLPDGKPTLHKAQIFYEFAVHIYKLAETLIDDI